MQSTHEPILGSRCRTAVPPEPRGLELPEFSRRHPVDPPRPWGRWASLVRIVDSRSAGTRPATGGRCEPPTTPRSTCDAPRPAGEAWAAGPGPSRLFRAAPQGRPAGPRSAPSEPPCTAEYSATTSRSLVTARQPGSGDARRAPVRCQHDRLALPHRCHGRPGSWELPSGERCGRVPSHANTSR